MFKFAMALLLAVPTAALADNIPANAAPVGTFTVSYVYVYDTAAASLRGHNRSLMGWSAIPEFNFVKHGGLQAEFSDLYVRSIYPGQTRFIAAAGPRFNLAPRSSVTPFLFAEGGEMRLSTQYSPIKDWNPVAKGGIGFDFRAGKAMAFTLVPGEYLGQYMDDGTWTHSFTARAGITFNLY